MLPSSAKFQLSLAISSIQMSALRFYKKNLTSFHSNKEIWEVIDKQRLAEKCLRHGSRHESRK